MFSAPPFPFVGGLLPALASVPNCHANPITQRVRRKRQRLPPSLLIENASNAILRVPENSPPEAFPIKASDHSSSSADRADDYARRNDSSVFFSSWFGP